MRARIPTTRSSCAFVTRLPDISGGRRRFKADFKADGTRDAERLVRGVDLAFSRSDAYAIARLCAMKPLCNVQRNQQRCMMGATFSD